MTRDDAERGEVFRNRRRRSLVVCDARWDPETGLAAIAVTGALGTHTQTIVAATNMIAEARAVLMAMDIALADGHKRPPTLVFRTDCQGLVAAKRFKGEQGELVDRMRRRLARFRQWELEFAHRRHTGRAHRAAANEWAGGAQS